MWLNVQWSIVTMRVLVGFEPVFGMEVLRLVFVSKLPQRKP